MNKILIGLLLSSSLSAFAGDCSLSLYFPELKHQPLSYQKKIFASLANKNYGPIEEGDLDKLETTYLLTTEVIGVFNFQRRAIVTLFKDKYDDENTVVENTKKILGNEKRTIKKMIDQLPSCK